MKFLDGWTIKINKIPKYTEMKKNYLEDVDVELLKLTLNKITDTEQKIKIQNVLDKVKNNTISTSYYQKYGIGRFYPTNNIGLLPIKRSVKNTLFKYQNYIDIDQVKGHITILLELAKKNNHSIAIYEQYLENFDEIVKEFQEQYNPLFTKKEVKNLFNITIYGGNIYTWFKQLEKDGWTFLTKEPNDFYLDFKKDSDILQGIILSHNKDLLKIVEQPNKQHYENDNTAFSYYCQIIENEINYQALLFLKEKKLINKYFSWGLDGITFPNGEFDIDELNTVIRNKTGFTDIKYIVKGFDETFDDLINTRKKLIILTEKERIQQAKDEELKLKNEMKKIKLEKDRMKLEQMNNRIQIDEDNIKQLIEMTEEFEKTHLKIVNKSFFIKHTDDEFILMSEHQLITSYKDKWYGYDKDGNRMNFIQRWLNNNDTQRKKLDIGCYPNLNKCPSHIFNTWTPFAMSLIKEFEYKEYELNFILNHIKILCGNDIPTYEHFILWLAQMLQYPDVKTCCPFLVSAKGAGKGTLMSLIQKIIGTKKYKETANPSRDVWGNFNEDMGSCFFVNLDEMSKKELMSSEDKFKALITNPVLTINGKGKTPYDIVSHHRFLATTNGEDFNPDRRCWIIRASDEKITDKQYFEDLRNMIEDVNVVKTVYEYLMNIKGAENFNKIPIPQTEFQNDLKEANRPIVEQWLYNFVIENDGKIEDTLLGSQIFSKFVSWRDTNKIQFEVNAIKLALKIKQLNLEGIKKGVPTNKGNTTIFNIPLLKKHFNIGCLIKLEEDIDDESG